MSRLSSKPLPKRRSQRSVQVVRLLVLISRALGDFFVEKIPPLRSLRGYAFIVHPRSIDDVYSHYPLFRRFPEKFLRFFLLHFWPITISRITGAVSLSSGEEIPGWMISSPIIPELLISDRKRAEQSFMRAVRLAERKGARYIGLGALSASLTKGGT